MSFEASVELKFTSTYTSTSAVNSIIDDDFLPEENLVITAPASDLTIKQYFKLYEKFLLAVGMSPSLIRDGAMSLVFNDWNSESEQRKLCEKYEVTLNEDLPSKFKEWKELADSLKSDRL